MSLSKIKNFFYAKIDAQLLFYAFSNCHINNSVFYLTLLLVCVPYLRSSDTQGNATQYRKSRLKQFFQCRCATFSVNMLWVASGFLFTAATWRGGSAKYFFEIFGLYNSTALQLQQYISRLNIDLFTNMYFLEDI